jgi:hypothetical protein
MLGSFVSNELDRIRKETGIGNREVEENCEKPQSE